MPDMVGIVDPFPGLGAMGEYGRRVGGGVMGAASYRGVADYVMKCSHTTDGRYVLGNKGLEKQAHTSPRTKYYTIHPPS